jgi:hypothetical protein
LFSVVIRVLVGNLAEEQGFLTDIRGNTRKIPDKPELLVVYIAVPLVAVE